MSAGHGEIARRYAGALRTALADEGDEGALSAAYDIGRDAVRQGLSVMDLVAVHNAALVEELRTTGERAAERTARAAGDFLLESVSAYEMLARVLRQTSETAQLEQRHAALLRRLSGFLADASLAVDAHASTQEVLQLVAEHALEVVEADACSARLEPSDGDGDGDVAAREAEAQANDAAPDRATRDLLAKLYHELGARGGPVRLAARAVAQRVPGAEIAWLAAPFTALDGHVTGLLALYSLGADRSFSAVDEAVLVQLAQMASATFERMDRYRR